jgi:peptidoglycan/xylan/chitin deacetylase (PgdA/CDA1 family)
MFLAASRAVAARVLPPALAPRQVRALAPRFVAGTLAATSVLTVWVGATSASASWFGPVTSHADRVNPSVAITFDVASDRGTAALGRQLQAAGVQGTFFTSGRALASGSTVDRELMGEGHLLGSRSQRASSAEFFDPRFHGLSKAQQVFRQELNVCPTFFEPVAGRHTPLAARAVRHLGMTSVTWDIVMDDTATGPASVHRMLDHVQAGSIIHLRLDPEDGPGMASARAAVAQLLSGLSRQGLHPVRLDTLLGRPGYAGHC